VLGFSGVAAFGIAPDSVRDTVPVQSVVRALPNPVVDTADPSTADELRYWREERIRRGDTIGAVLARLDVDDPEATAFLRVDPTARPLYQLKPGKALRVETDADGRLASLRFVGVNGELLEIARGDSGFKAKSSPAPTEVRWEMAAGEITSSLFAAADAANVPDAVTLQLADVFGGDIDFFHDLERGDRFAVVYEMRYLDGEPIGSGRIVAAEFTNRDRTQRAFLWRDSGGGEPAYYAPDGTALRKTFLRSPMEFSRVASGFSSARFHPVLQDWRAHNGIDYPAPLGTPVRATAGGTVLFSGTQNGYGNVIHVQHRGEFSTLYAHLSRIAPDLHVGARVAQGDVIGYVGQTGWATGPHLHYELRVADAPRDPLSVVMPDGEPLPAASRAAFATWIKPAAAQLVFAQSFASRAFAASE
jgi:murein DD-endopeptidase MepM/ murein hydrolase activator NlpD